MQVLNKKQFVLDSKSLKIKEILNKDFLEVEILAIAEGENRNETSFTLDGMKKSIPTFYNKFILGYFNVQGDVNNDGNFEEHNSDVKYDKDCEEFYYSYLAPNAEKALGLIRESDKVEIVEVNGKKWIKLTAAILTKYNREAVKHLLKSKNKKKVSVEITIEKSHEENGITIIEEFTLDGITILGTRKNSKRPCEEGIEGASMILRFLQSEVYNTQKKALNFAYQELETEALNTNEEQENVTMQNDVIDLNTQERGTILMLTYEQKRGLLEAKLRELIHDNCCEETECCVYCWVCDLDDNEVYYCYNDAYYKASYLINEEDSNVEINVAEAKQVTRSWQEFALEEQVEKKQETFAEEDANDKEECSVEEEKTEEEASEVKEKEECSTEEEEKKEDEEEDLEDKEEECGTQCSEEDENEEDNSKEINKEEKEAKDVNGEIFSEEKHEEESVSENFVENANNEEEVVNEENSYKEYTLELKTFKETPSEDSSTEVVISTTEENYAQVMSAYEETKTTLESLRTNYMELKAKYDKMILDQTIESFCAYGKELFENEEALETESKSSLIAEFETKCKNNEFASEDEIKQYSEDQIAKAVYQQVKNNKEKISETTNFSTKIKSSVNQSEVVVEVEDSMTKMKNILKI